MSVERRFRGCCASVAGCVPSSGKPVVSKKSRAMRTAIPLLTCSSTHDCGASATSGEISIPRFIGPGCSTMAFGFAWRRRPALSWYSKM